jgi:glycosyltransferase involved in cell wall biosynthesis
MESGMSLCEVRIPTYKRPDLLKRALSNLRKQTYDNWQAIAFDDSPEQEVKFEDPFKNIFAVNYGKI